MCYEKNVEILRNFDAFALRELFLYQKKTLPLHRDLNTDNMVRYCDLYAKKDNVTTKMPHDAVCTAQNANRLIIRHLPPPPPEKG